MNDVEQLERLLNTRFDAVHQRFDGLDREMRDVKADIREVKRQTTLTNGRVNAHDVTLAGHKARLDGVSDDVDELKDAASPQRMEEMLQSAVSSITTGLADMKGRVTIEAETGEKRRLTKWDANLFVAGIGLGASAIFGLIKFIEWAIHSIKATP